MQKALHTLLLFCSVCLCEVVFEALMMMKKKKFYIPSSNIHPRFNSLCKTKEARPSQLVCNIFNKW